MTTSSAIPQTCDYCGAHHLFTTCPRIRSIEYHESGAIKRVEFHGPRYVYDGQGDFSVALDESVKPADLPKSPK